VLARVSETEVALRLTSGRQIEHNHRLWSRSHVRSHQRKEGC